MKDWDKDKYVHEDVMGDVPDDIQEQVDALLKEHGTECESCGFVFHNDEISRNDFYTICTNEGCESRRELIHEVEPLTWAEVYNWVYEIIKD